MKKFLKKLGKDLYLSATGGKNREHFSIHGTTVYVPVSIGQKIRYIIARGRYEKEEAGLIKQHINVDDNVIELGGALGVISKVIRAQIGPNAKHIVVEPNIEIFEFCKINAKADKIVNAAIAYDVQSVSMSSDASLLDNRIALGNNDTSTSVSIPAVTLSDLIKSLSGENYILVCDIEGSEAELVEKDPKAFKNCTKIIMEIHPEFIQSNWYNTSEMIDSLSTMGFQKISLEKNVLYMERT